MGMTASDYFRQSFEATEIGCMIDEQIVELEQRFDNQIAELKALFISELDKQKNEIDKLKIENYQLIQENGELRKQLADLISKQDASYPTLGMQAVHGAYREFWENYQDGKIPPKKTIITKWIKDNYSGISDNIADAIDTIIRPPQYSKGGKKAR